VQIFSKILSVDEIVSTQQNCYYDSR